MIQEKLITFDQKKVIVNLGSEAMMAAISKVNLNSLSAENDIINKGVEFKNRVEEAVKAIIMDITTPNKYAKEIVVSKYDYPHEYKCKSIDEQVKKIATIFGLQSMEALEFIKKLPILPDGAEGWFAIPKVSAVRKKYFPSITDIAEQYCEALKLVQVKIAEKREFNNYRKGEITTRQIRQHSRTLRFIQQLEYEQSGDILIIAAQYGMRHRGKSIRRARETFSDNEFGLGAFALCCMVLVHPDRYVNWDELDTCCVGDEFALHPDGEFSDAPILNFEDDLEFLTSNIEFVDCRFGSPSGFFL